jgi:hypothetical protein
MENQNINQTQEQKQPQGWRDVVITPDMPLSAIVQFLNVLNQRLCGIEDTVVVALPTGEEVSITKAYELQAEAEMAAQNRQEPQGE